MHRCKIQTLLSLRIDHLEDSVSGLELEGDQGYNRFHGLR